MNYLSTIYCIFWAVPTADQNQEGKGPHHPVVAVATRTMLVPNEENDRRLCEEQKTEYACAAVHADLSAKASNMFVILNHRSVMFPIK